jgi:acetyl esterase
MPDTITANHTVAIEDVEYQKGMLARLYRPSGAGPFPAALQVHGGAWTSKDRTDNDFMAKALAESGIFVASIDFRMPPVAPHPGSIQDINLGIRWLKANAREFKSRPEWVGSWGTSSGGHQVLLAAMRALSPIYSALPGPAGSMQSRPGSSRAGACSTRFSATTSRKRPATRNSCICTTASG